jgi:hypothetical protein
LANKLIPAEQMKGLGTILMRSVYVLNETKIGLKLLQQMVL